MSDFSTLGVVGLGFVGTAVREGMKHAFKVIYYDKYKQPCSDDNRKSTLAELVSQCDGPIFICVPTPMNPDSSCDTSIVSETVVAINKLAKGKHSKPVLIVKSTIVPGTTEKLNKENANVICVFNPEFLTEANNIEDFKKQDRVILGGPHAGTAIAKKVYQKAYPLVPTTKTSSTIAELVKYVTNSFLAVKVSFANEIAELCQKLDVDYDKVIEYATKDKRLGVSHWAVPGPDGMVGWGGKCLKTGSLVNTPCKCVVIDDLCVGDVVSDKTGMTNVTGVTNRIVNDSIEIVAAGRRLVGSKDHIQIVWEKGILKEREFKDIKVNDCVFIPEPGINGADTVVLGDKPNKYVKWWPDRIKLTNSLVRVLGLYSAEGCCGQYTRKSRKSAVWNIVWTQGQEYLATEVYNVLKDIGLNPLKRFQVSQGTFGESRCWIVRIRSAGFAKLLHSLDLGSNAHNKNCVMLHRDLIPSFIGGWLDGDGSIYKGTISGYSESKRLITSIDRMLLSCGIHATISKNGRQINIATREAVKKVCSWTTRLSVNEKLYRRNFSYESPICRKVDGGWAVRISRISQLSKCKVFAIETESGTYVANNILTHNCFPKDLNALIYLAKKLGCDPLVALAAWEKNLMIRPIKDWETSRQK